MPIYRAERFSRLLHATARMSILESTKNGRNIHPRLTVNDFYKKQNIK